MSDLFAPPGGWRVRIIDLSGGAEDNIVEEIKGFPTLMQANAFARRYVRDSVELCRAPGAAARDVLDAWFASARTPRCSTPATMPGAAAPNCPTSRTVPPRRKIATGARSTHAVMRRRMNQIWASTNDDHRPFRTLSDRAAACR
jgi:hypothetical protein